MSATTESEDPDPSESTPRTHWRLSGVLGWAVLLVVALTVIQFVVAGALQDRTGLRREVYAQTSFGGTRLTDDATGSISLAFLDEDETLPRRNFSVRWQAFWYLPDATNVVLHGEGDDRLDVWVDGELVLERRSGRHDDVPAVLTLDAGVHVLRVDYQQHGGDAGLYVGVTLPYEQDPRPLSSQHLFLEAPDSGDFRLVLVDVMLQDSVPVLWAALIAILWMRLLLFRSPETHSQDAANSIGSASPAGPTPHNRRSVIVAVVAYTIAIGMFVKNAWVTEDAYIVFRSVEQLFAGNGPVWNPHERVQAFTSPLWFGLVALSRALSSDLYLNVILLSGGLWLVTVRNLQRLAPNSVAFALGVLLCVTSTALIDYTSSGLENALAYALSTAFLVQVVRLDRVPLPDVTRTLTRLCLMFGLIAITRHDLVLLVLPPALLTCWRHRHRIAARSWLSLASAACLPLAAWTLFALFYYGFPWPNTAYAKLNTGIDRADLILQGLRYLQVALLHDPITPLVTAAALIICFRSRFAVFRFVGAGVLLNLLYVVSVGGDFMLGRFLSYAYLVGTCVLIRECRLFASGFSPAWTLGGGSIVKERYGVSAAALTGAAVVLYAVLFPHTPVNSLAPDSAHVRSRWGIDSHRHVYPELALFEYLRHSEEDGPWPTHRWAAQERRLPHSADFVHEHGAIGMRGYVAGPDKIIVDVFALSDPLLARLPARPGSRIGHFTRPRPAGYLERLEAMAAARLNVRDVRNVQRELVAGLRPWRRDTSVERIKSFSRMYPIAPPELNELYTRLAIVTQSDLWSMERLKTILLFNLGAYDHLTGGGA
ncbi:MAG: hypothetical protein F4Z04_08015 [Acidobacteria bacterium]|nr:hypothetical protein [Acidobacteriota bacterium]